MEGEFRHWDHRFEWTRAEFEKWAIDITKEYPEYSVEFDGIGKHWDGDDSKGFCSQAAIFTRRNSERAFVMEKDTVEDFPNFEKSSPEVENIHQSFEKLFSCTIPAFDFDMNLYQRVMQALDPVLGWVK